MSAETLDIHRYLDAAFGDITMTPDVQDLKEEIRGNLSARSAELQAGGMDAASAASTAIRELGDIHTLIDSLGDARPASTGPAGVVTLNRVRPRPAFVVRTVILSLVLAAGVVAVTIGALSGMSWTLFAGLAVVLPIGVITVDALLQETSQHYPLPAARAFGYGVAAALLSAGIVVGATFVDRVPQLVVGIAFALVGIVLFVWLGVTQTNRTKPWALELQRSQEFPTRFDTDPASAARFGIYTVVIWVLGLGAFVALSIIIGFVWSWIALLVTIAVFFLVLARMLFPHEK